MKKALKQLLGTEIHVLLAAADVWYDLIPINIDEEEEVVYFTDITEDDEEDESVFWEMAVRISAILAIGKRTGKVQHDIETYIGIINGDESDGTDEGD